MDDEFTEFVAARYRALVRHGALLTGDQEGRATARVVLDALRALPPQQRVVLVLRYWVDLPEQEIAALLGCSPGTVKSRASRALAALRATPIGRMALDEDATV